jgi:glycosyltransferase involved in cell wall biosynthesis
VKVLYYLPVQEKYITAWDYYQVDMDALHDLFDEVVVCNSIWEVMRSHRNAGAIYCWWWHTSTLVVLLGRLLGIKTVVTGAIHMFDLSGARDYYSGSFLFRIATACGLSLADANLFISHDQFRQVTSHLHVRNPLIVRSSLGKVQPHAQEYVLEARKNVNKVTKGKVVFLSIVWQTPEQLRRKGIWETLDAMALLKAGGISSFEWIVAGMAADGTEILRSKVRELGLSNEVTVLTDVSPSKKSELYLAADLYIQPSWCEGFGNAVLEAMSHGAPALVSRYTAQPEGVGDKGLIALDVSPFCITERLRDFMSLEESERRRFSEEALIRALNEFSYDKRVCELATMFADLGVKTAKFGSGLNVRN